MSSNFEPLENLSVRKSNELVSAKYKSTLLENQIMAIALTRIEAESDRSNKTQLVSRLYPGELKRLIGDPTHIYRTLKTVSNTMTGHSMIIEDGKGNFNAFAVVTNCDYVNGVFEVRFNEKLRDHILGLEKNYTTLELSVLTSLKRSPSFRLYELLKREIYKSKKSINNGRVDVEYRISELRFMIGLANIDDQGVKNALARERYNINWDEIYQKLDKKDRKYEAWGELQRNVIRPAQEELKERSNIQFEYEGIKEGRKMARILFHVYPNEPKDFKLIDEKMEILSESNKYRKLDTSNESISEFFRKYEGHNELKKEDLDFLLKKANNNISVVEKAIQMADTQQQIDNYMGWIISCIQNGYERVETLNGSAETAKVIRKLTEDYESNKKETALRVWEKCKDRVEFNDFTMELLNVGLSLEKFDTLYEADEKTDIYFTWKRSGTITL